MLNPYKAHTWFSSEFVLNKSTRGWWAFQCPMCNELVDRQKMAVHFSYGIVKCWVCEYKSRIIDFVMEVKSLSYMNAKELIHNCKPANVELETVKQLEHSVIKSDVVLPDGYQTILEGAGILGQRARKYLSDRGFDLEELDKKGVGYCNEQALIPEENFFGYIIIPFKTDGKLVYYIGRDFTGNFLRYKNPPKEKFGVGKADLFFNEDALFLYDEVFFSEGWADACEMGRKGVSTQGWSLSKTQKNKMFKSDANTFVFLPDSGNDGTGRSFYSKAVETAMDFIDYKKVFVLDLNQLREFGKDANEIKKERILNLYKQTEPLTLESASSILME